MGIRVLGDVVIGISKPGTPEPDLDLTRFNGEEHGVSRRHAVLRPGQNRLFLIDLQSTNGTRVNAGAVTPGTARELHNLDTISLGALSFTVKILATPEQLVSQMSAQYAAR
jgi:pSer/pThr/pTyr-binding forkhead associated (FHA) protein